MKPIIRGVVLSAISLIVLTACNDKGDKKAATQVAAKVNDGEISVHQVNLQLRRGNVSADELKVVSAQVLDRLIEQEVVVQRAHEKKLDRDPVVMQQIEAAKRDVLAKAYLDSLGVDAAKPTDVEIKEYFIKHPELFRERRTYNFHVVTVQANQAQQLAIQEQMSKIKALDEIVPWLKAKNLRFTDEGGMRPAEQIPMQLLQHMSQMKDGQTTANETPAGLELIQLLQSRLDPVSEERARPVIEQFLANQHVADLMQQEVKNLRAKAKIEYLGEFKPLGAASSGAVTPITDGASASEDVATSVAAGMK